MNTIRNYATEIKDIEKFNSLMLKQMVSIAIPSILQQSIVSIGTLLVQSVVNGLVHPY